MNKIKWAVPGKAAVLCDGQFGSTGKGLIAAWLANYAADSVDVATTNAGAQAGHTTCFADGRKYVTFHLPTLGVEKPMAKCYINAGSVIDYDSLVAELAACGVEDHRVVIHPRAAVITPEAREIERDVSSSTTRLASTQKGVGATLAAKVMRQASLAGTDDRLTHRVGMMDLNKMMRYGATVTLEIPQGLGLSLNHGLEYPYCTSRDCYVGSGLSDAGIHPHFLGNTCMVVRTKPIRVGNIYDAEGNELGTSGPFYGDSRELTWGDFPGVTPERTTVTKRVRRIATWSNRQYIDGLTLNRPDIVALTFCDYLSGPGEFNDYLLRMRIAEEQVGIRPLRLYSVGPNVEDVTDSPDWVARWLGERK